MEHLTTKELNQIDEWVMERRATISEMMADLPESDPDQMVYVPKKRTWIERIKNLLK